MRYFCTYFDINYLSRGLALHRSLLQHADAFELILLCMDDAVEARLRSMALANVKLVSVTELAAKHPALAAARLDRTKLEFYFTCTPWLLREWLPQIPPGELLTYLDSDLFFFNSPREIYDEIGRASVAITPHRFPQSIAHLERYGKFNVGWVSFRNDAVGAQCAADWAEKCAEWCFNTLEEERYADQKYLDAWPARFAGTVSITHPGVNVAPWNIKDAVIARTPRGLTIDGRTLIFYHFHALESLGQQLYDPNFHKYDAIITPELRNEVYLPYIRQLLEISPVAGQEAPELLPPADPRDPRSLLACDRLIAKLRSSELDRGIRLLYVNQIERDRIERLKSINFYQEKLKTSYDDLERNVKYLKTLEAEIAAHVGEAQKRDAIIADLNTRLAQSEARAAQQSATAPSVPGGSEPALAEFAHYSTHFKKVVVVKYHRELLPYILWMAATGVSVDVFESPAELAEANNGPVCFATETLWERLGSIDSLFNGGAYLAANPDVATAVGQGLLPSAWDHYMLFGQSEQRLSGSPKYSSGIGDYNAVVFHAEDFPAVLPLIAGRLQSHNKLIIKGSGGDLPWLPGDCPRTVLANDLLLYVNPPKAWLGPCLPSQTMTVRWPRLRAQDIYPEKPNQTAEWPRITVVTVSYNQAVFLEATLRSVLDQGYPNLEYLVVDGGSTDGSVEIIQRYASKLTWWISEKDTGQSNALNKGFKRATGHILTWLNSDDRLAPGSLFTIAEAFLLHKTDIVVGRCARFMDHEIMPHHFHRSSIPLGSITPLRVDDLLDLDGQWLKGKFFHQPEVFYTRELFERCGGALAEDLYYSMDYDLWVRMAKAQARIFAIPEIVAMFRQHKNQKTAGDELPYLPELRKVNAAHRQSQSAPSTS